MVLGVDRLQALRDCCRDEAAFERLRQILALETDRSSELLGTVAEATSQLLTQSDYATGINAALALMGEATGVDRVYIFHIHPHPDTGEPAASQQYEWVRASITPQINNPALQNRVYQATGLMRWYDLLQAGRPLSALIDQLPPSERKVFKLQEIRSILVVPIFSDNALWGFIGFDDCHRERHWSADEEAALQVLAASVGGAIARQQAASALSQSESRLQTIAANVPGMIYQLRRHLDGSRQVIYASSGCRELLELEPEQIQATSAILASLCHPDDQERFEQSIERSGVTLQPWNWEGRIITPSGKLKWIQGFSRPDLQSNGEIVWDGVLVDITERQQVEAELRRSEARNRAMLDASPDLMFRISLNGRYLDFKSSPTATIPKEGIVGRYLHDVLPSDVADLCLRTIRTTLTTQTLQTCEYQLDEPTGKRDYEARVVVSGTDEVLWIVQDVTERKQTERTIRQSEARNRALVDAIPDLMFRIRRDGTYLDCKAERDGDTLLPPQELIGKSVYDVLPPDHAAQRMYYVEQALKTGEIQSFEYQLNLGQGTEAESTQVDAFPELERPDSLHIREYEARVVVSGDDEVIAIVRDITERKCAETALRLSEEKFSKAFHSSPNSMTLSTVQEGRIIEVNQSFLETSGYDRNEVIGRRVHDLGLWVNPVERDAMIRILRQNGTIRNQEYQFRIKSGEIITTLFSAEIIQVGDEICILASVIDITARQRAEQELWAAAERDRLLGEIALRIRQSLDLDQTFSTTVAEVRQFLQADRVFISQFDETGHGCIVAESVNAEFPSVLNWIIDPAIYAEMTALYGQGTRVIADQSQVQDITFAQESYDRFHTRAALGVPIVIGDRLFGALVAHQCSGPRQWQSQEVHLMERLGTQVAIAIQQAQLYTQVQDLNAGLERQVAERTAQLQQKMEELQELNQLKDDFLNAFSHDLRTPMMGISLVISNLMNQSGDTIAVSRAVLERMVQSTSHQLNLLNSLLQAHSAEVRGVILNYELVQLSLLLQVIVEDLEPLVQKNTATLVSQVPPDLPLVQADPLQLRRVFENLITNALHHNPPGVHLVLDASIEEDFIRLTLTDDGVGMSPDVSETLFERYSRGRKSRHSTGIGLGLYLCRQIITAHGGQIGVESTPGEGSTFWLTLPLAISANARPDPSTLAEA